MRKILVHTCCGICSAYPLQNLKELGYEPVAYFYNPNIDTEEEFEKRLEGERIVCENSKTELIVEPYVPEEYENYVIGYETEPEHGRRCDKCFELRLEKTFQKAKELGIDIVTTTMIISPHKNFKQLTEVGNGLADKYGVEYLAVDFKKKDGFLKTNRISKELGLYRQNYCGCRFAKRD